MKIQHLFIRGRVQGVGYRAWTERVALRQELEGWVRNCRNGAVEVVFAGPEEAVAAAIEACHRGPSGAQVDTVEVRDGDTDLLRLLRPGERFSVLPTAQ